MGSTLVQGCRNYDKKFLLRQTDEDGKNLSPVRKSTKDIMKYEKWDGMRV